MQPDLQQANSLAGKAGTGPCQPPPHTGEGLPASTLQPAQPSPPPAPGGSSNLLTVGLHQGRSQCPADALHPAMFSSSPGWSSAGATSPAQASPHLLQQEWGVALQNTHLMSQVSLPLISLFVKMLV